jgi:gliding motility-associated-like protein
MKKIITLLLTLVTFNVYSQDQTIELCDNYNNIFTYYSLGTPNCTYTWKLYLNNRLYKTFFTENITIEYEKVGIYKIEVQSENKLCNSNVQNYVINVVPCQIPALYVPTSFTPNNDNLNDVWSAKGQHIETIDITIYNRWGKVIFHTLDIDQIWDGFNAPQDAYIYYITYKDTKGQYGIEYGTITLYR